MSPIADDRDSIPDSHAWTDIHDHPTVEPIGPDAVPVVDLTSPNAASLIRQACESWGAFQLIGHGVPARLFEQLESQAGRLFALPDDEKQKVARLPGSIAGYGTARISSFFEKKLWSEGFTIPSSPYDYASKLWPEDPAQFCDVIDEYREEMKELGRKLMELMILSTEDTGKLVDPVTRGSGVLQLNWYPACPEPGRAMGMAPHTDSGLVTMLYQDSRASALQILRPEDQHGPTRWVTVPPLPGTLVFMVGDLAHILSNGRFLNALHRALVNRDVPRLSAVYFCLPPADINVSPSAHWGLAGAPIYRSVTWPEYIDLKKSLFDRALTELKVPKKEEEDNADALYAIKKQTASIGTEEYTVGAM